MVVVGRYTSKAAANKVAVALMPDRTKHSNQPGGNPKGWIIHSGFYKRLCTGSVHLEMHQAQGLHEDGPTDGGNGRVDELAILDRLRERRRPRRGRGRAKR
jgi:hypothetical protein